MKKVSNKVEYLPITELKLLEYNPRKISEANFERLKDKIRKHPDLFEGRPCLVSDRTGELVVFAGNQRLKAAESLGMTEVPCVVYHGLSEKSEKEKAIVDNVEEGEWWEEMLAEHFGDIDLEGLGAGIELELPDDLDEPDEPTKDKMQKVVCPECGKEFEI